MDLSVLVCEMEVNRAGFVGLREAWIESLRLAVVNSPCVIVVVVVIVVVDEIRLITVSPITRSQLLPSKCS